MLRIALFGAVVVLMVLMFNRCTVQQYKFERKLIHVDKVNFYGTYEKVANDTLLEVMIPAINSAFELGTIEKSEADYEIRVYFFNAYGELFFRQKFLNDWTEAAVYNCKTAKRGDSLVMQIKNVVKTTGDYKFDDSYNLGYMPKFITSIDTAQKDGITDDGALYFIQVKRKDTINFIVIDQPFEKESSNEYAKSICNMMRRFRTNFSFAFHDPIAKVLDSAFIRPYGLESNSKVTMNALKNYIDESSKNKP